MPFKIFLVGRVKDVKIDFISCSEGFGDCQLLLNARSMINELLGSNSSTLRVLSCGNATV